LQTISAAVSANVSTSARPFSAPSTLMAIAGVRSPSASWRRVQ
jgi:hypothetical protein